MTDGMATKVPGHLKMVSLKDKSITPHGDGSPIGRSDGLARRSVTARISSVTGSRGRSSASGARERRGCWRIWVRGPQISGHDPKSATAFIPQMKTGMLYGYKVE